MVGSNRSKAESVIRKALNRKSSIQLAVSKFKRTDNKIDIISLAEGDLSNQDLQIALVQKMATMDIKAGENSGAKLSHTNVVRVLISQELKEKNEINLIIPDDLSDTNWELILFSRRKTDLKITGALRYNARK
jgi:hypothetical protein